MALELSLSALVIFWCAASYLVTLRRFGCFFMDALFQALMQISAASAVLKSTKANCLLLLVTLSKKTMQLRMKFLCLVGYLLS